jgi:hypothetical protein
VGPVVGPVVGLPGYRVASAWRAGRCAGGERGSAAHNRHKMSDLPPLPEGDRPATPPSVQSGPPELPQSHDPASNPAACVSEVLRMSAMLDWNEQGAEAHGTFSSFVSAMLPSHATEADLQRLDLAAVEPSDIVAIEQPVQTNYVTAVQLIQSLNLPIVASNDIAATEQPVQTNSVTAVQMTRSLNLPIVAPVDIAPTLSRAELDNTNKGKKKRKTKRVKTFHWHQYKPELSGVRMKSCCPSCQNDW